MNFKISLSTPISRIPYQGSDKSHGYGSDGEEGVRDEGEELARLIMLSKISKLVKQACEYILKIMGTREGGRLQRTQRC